MLHEGEIQAHFQVTLETLVKRCLHQSWRPRIDHPALSYSLRCSSPTHIKVKGLSGLPNRNTSDPSREPLSHLFEEEQQQGVFICTSVHSAQSHLPGLGCDVTQLGKNNNEIYPLTPLSRSFQEKECQYSHSWEYTWGENQACSLTEGECQGMEAKVRPGGGGIDHPQDTATIRHSSPSVHLKPSKPTTGKETGHWMG